MEKKDGIIIFLKKYFKWFVLVFKEDRKTFPKTLQNGQFTEPPITNIIYQGTSFVFNLQSLIAKIISNAEQ